MDWYAWLCRAGLHPDVAFEYALLFARNELGAADVRHLDHDFLATMGVAVAKHRLDILKLARKESSSAVAAATALPWRATRLLAAAAHRSARCALGRLRAALARARECRGGRPRPRDRAAALLAAPRVALHPAARHRGGAGGRVAAAHTWSKIVASPVAIRRAGGHVGVVGRPVLLTSSCASKWSWGANGGAAVKALPAPAVPISGCGFDDDDDDDDDDDEVFMDVVCGDDEEMRWESLFQDLKPT
ncbi:hypothetical protein U9M48_029560 [Paspalum notatum var. saurae]|uniref:SAM domain-containing protein n=1 Tax=Paspalum notatum var. saurae TaxID=547442 RepID=A0AAQ3U3L4_PASNO